MLDTVVQYPNRRVKKRMYYARRICLRANATNRESKYEKYKEAWLTSNIEIEKAKEKIWRETYEEMKNIQEYRI